PPKPSPHLACVFAIPSPCSRRACSPSTVIVARASSPCLRLDPPNDPSMIESKRPKDLPVRHTIPFTLFLTFTFAFSTPAHDHFRAGKYHAPAIGEVIHVTQKITARKSGSAQADGRPATHWEEVVEFELEGDSQTLAVDARGEETKLSLKLDRLIVKRD